MIAHATIFLYRLIMGKKLGLDQHRAWAIFITRHSKVFGRIEKSLENRKGLLPLHLYDVLLALKNTPNQKLRLSEIADQIVTSRSALSRSVEKLDKLGLLKKTKAQEDGRGQFAEITQKGLKAMSDTWPHYESAIQEHFGQHLNNEEAKSLIEILKKLKSD